MGLGYDPGPIHFIFPLPCHAQTTLPEALCA